MKKYPHEKPLLNPEMKKARVDFCTEIQYTDWENIIFSDESSFVLNWNKKAIWTNEHPAYIEKSPGYKSILVWGAICTKGCVFLQTYFAKNLT